MNRFERVKQQLIASPRSWLITGCAGFIGSNLLESLLKLDQTVAGLDNFSTGYRRNLNEVRHCVSEEQWSRFTFIQGDIRDLDTCRQAVRKVNYVLHEAALGSVPRSIEDPVLVNEVNINGFLNMLVASKEAKISSFVYAGSSSVYGDLMELPKVESRTGNPLSPYAVTKSAIELYASVFARCYGFESIGLRYFNVFGKRQDPNGAYAAVIPRWIAAMLNGERIVINGNGNTSRDFTFVDNVVQANVLAATADRRCRNKVYNVAVGKDTTLNQLFEHLKSIISAHGIKVSTSPVYQDFRSGDVMHSQADISMAADLLGYAPAYRVYEGLESAMKWYLEQNGKLTMVLPKLIAERAEDDGITVDLDSQGILPPRRIAARYPRPN